MKPSTEKALNPFWLLYSFTSNLKVEAYCLLTFLKTMSRYKLVWKFLKVNVEAIWAFPLFHHYTTTTTFEETLLVTFWTIKTINQIVSRETTKIC